MAAGFSALGDAFTQILERFKKLRIDQETEVSPSRVINHIPVPLMTVNRWKPLLINKLQGGFSALHNYKDNRFKKVWP